MVRTAALWLLWFLCLLLIGYLMSYLNDRMAERKRRAEFDTAMQSMVLDKIKDLNIKDTINFIEEMTHDNNN